MNFVLEFRSDSGHVEVGVPPVPGMVAAIRAALLWGIPGDRVRIALL